MTVHSGPSRRVTGRLLDDVRGTMLVPLAHLLAVCDPLDGDTWGVGPLSVADIWAGPDCGHSLDIWARGHHLMAHIRDACRGCQVGRILHLVENAWPPLAEDRYPVTVDVGLFGWIPHWPIIDGNHRVAAATVRGDGSIEVAVAGDWDLAYALLINGSPWP